MFPLYIPISYSHEDNVSGLKNNPSEALRQAREEPVLVMNSNTPDALMVNVRNTATLDMPGVRAALATALFKDGGLSLNRAVAVAEMSLSEFITHLSRLGILIVRQSEEEANQDLETLDQWLAS